MRDFAILNNVFGSYTEEEELGQTKIVAGGTSKYYIISSPERILNMLSWLNGRNLSEYVTGVRLFYEDGKNRASILFLRENSVFDMVEGYFFLNGDEEISLLKVKIGNETYEF